MTELVFDAIGWIGLVLGVGAFFLKNVTLLRLFTVIGCVLMFVYYTHADVPQGAISNVIVFGINIFYLLKMLPGRKVEMEEQLETQEALN